MKIRNLCCRSLSSNNIFCCCFCGSTEGYPYVLKEQQMPATAPHPPTSLALHFVPVLQVVTAHVTNTSMSTITLSHHQHKDAQHLPRYLPHIVSINAITITKYSPLMIKNKVVDVKFSK